jgi:tetratricopeptide (TPR) repeat protein
MSRVSTVTRWAMAAGILAAGALPGLAQDREYHIAGTVLDASKQPIAGATVELRERTSRRGFRTESGADGKFKLVGLPHGVYEVKVTKPGYQTRTAEWDLHEAQDNLRKVEFDPFVLLSEAQVSEIQHHTKLKGLLDEATALLQKRDFDAALAVLTKMLAESPDDVNALYMSGLCHVQKDHLDEATPLFEKVTQLAPGFAPARVQLAVCYDRRGDKERALAAYDKALELDPENVMVLYNAGVLRYNAGHAVEALPYFEKAVRLKPDDDGSLEMAGYCQLQALNYPEALQYLERARALITDPARAATLDEVLKELRPRVQATPPPGSGG